jgi:DNA-binding NtrC family response regulator
VADNEAWRIVARIGARECRATLGAAPLVAGSGPDCDLVLADPTVSRRHARLTATARGVHIEDLGSRNGTHLEGAGADAIAGPDARVRLGDVELRIERVRADDAVLADGCGIPPRAVARSGAGEPTLAGADLSRFAVRELAPLLELAVRADPTAFAARLVEGLAASIGDASFRLMHAEGMATIARAGHSDEPRERLVRGAHALEFACPADARHAARALATIGLALHSLVERGAGHREAAKPASPPAPEAPAPIATASPALREIYWQASRVASSRLNVLLTGESGTGKELLARFLHEASPEPPERFVAMNCAALPEDLLEAELFGIEAGVATGVAARAGRFELAHGGTLFLDEIGDMALETQARILRVLQERVVHRVGGHKARPADVRIVSATHRDLDQMVRDGRFRLDLYHRIADWRATLPSLRERREDIANLAACFLAAALAQRGLEPGGFTRGALDALTRYSWPGNVRELEREMQRVALFLEDREAVPSTMLKPEIISAPTASPEPDRSLASQLEHEERRILAAALAECGGQVTAAAERLGISRATLYRRLAQLELEVREG